MTTVCVCVCVCVLLGMLFKHNGIACNSKYNKIIVFNFIEKETAKKNKALSNIWQVVQKAKIFKSYFNQFCFSNGNTNCNIAESHSEREVNILPLSATHALFLALKPLFTTDLLTMKESLVKHKWNNKLYKHKSKSTHKHTHTHLLKQFNLENFH